MASSIDDAIAPGHAQDTARPGVSLTDLLLILTSVIWGANYIVVKYGTGVLDPLAYNGVRVALAVFGATGRADRESTLLGNLLVLAGAICWSVFTVLLKPYTHRLSLPNISALTMVGGAVPLALVSAPAILATDWRAVAPLTWAAIVYSGIGALVLAYLFWYRGVRVLGPTRTAMYSNLQPVIALLVAWAALSEVPTPWQGVGAATIIAGVILTRT